VEDFRIAPGTDEELQLLRKKHRFYGWIFVIILSIIITVVVALYLSYWPLPAGGVARYGRLASVPEGSTGITGSAGGGGQTVKTGGAGTACCGSPRRLAADEGLRRLADIALARFRAEAGHQIVTAKVIDYGCHIQIDICDSGNRVVRSYGWQDGALYPIK